ncbi:ABC transporter permease [Pseudooceanicola sediminis]|uniref:ABC transporter permease n=1 Tax=Pseudooceanicola sediminis TaxID=2211117 RepID=A0A399J4N8_9RHOB|nr:ABC transporter permease [Pseudooceanicola sediminis]KAA2315381.1 ABC transporter permease [Puniceibacterium sp. HSS470]RII40413.1 ABC transporter permease [Pseudooceanicola sediminis]|tara:strand:- start:19889 stop:20896 length:1008 start_codon:yes stop_codon:yes gene_type:complete
MPPLVKKLASAIGLLLAVVVLNFLLIQLAPGDPVSVIVGEMGGASEDLIAQMRAEYGLDKPVWLQLLIYVGKICTGDFGFSYYFKQPVLNLILQRLPATILLVVSALVLAVVIGTLMGIFSAKKPKGILSHFVTIFSLVGYAAPVFWTGLMLLILFASIIPMFPVSGMMNVRGNDTWYGAVLDVLHHLVLPAVTLASIYIATYSRLSRASMLDVLGSDYIRTARAKGLNERRVVFGHALRNGLIPVVTMIGLQFGQLFAGAVLVETVFNWPGLGRLAFESILRRDYPTLLAILFFSAILVMVANILTDLAYGRIDPRIGGPRRKKAKPRAAGATQ